ncbi:unnamed protein product, partial [Allacma fusca]
MCPQKLSSGGSRFDQKLFEYLRLKRIEFAYHQFLKESDYQMEN